MSRFNNRDLRSSYTIRLFDVRNKYIYTALRNSRTIRPVVWFRAARMSLNRGDISTGLANRESGQAENDVDSLSRERENRQTREAHRSLAQ